MSIAATNGQAELTGQGAFVSVEQQTITLLRSEIEALQTELTEKDSILEPTGSIRDESNDVAPMARLQELSAELESSDQRITELQDELRLTREASLADEEERRQLQNWVDDIEDRISEREGEWNAEKDVLNQRMGSAKQRHNELLLRFEGLVQGGGGIALEESLQVLRNENDRLNDRLAVFQRNCDDLEKEVSDLKKLNRAEEIQCQVNDEIRAERLQLAQERAVFSRNKVELTRQLQMLREKLEQQEREIHPADQKFNAFRERLKELHEQEKSEYVAPTLTQRIKHLWERLDGPTDRD